MTETLAVALHELRRPLQVAMLALAGRPRPASAMACLEQAAAALEQLEHALGLRAAPEPGRADRVAGADLLADARLRWQGLATDDCAAPVTVDRADRDLELRGDRRRLGAALDNLIANALEHGPGGPRVELRADPAGVALRVANGAAASAGQPAPSLRGHGLAVAARTASELGGRLERPQLEGGRIVSGLTLPPAEGPPRPAADR